MDRNDFKKEIQMLLEEDETLTEGTDDEIIYEIDGIKIYGGYEYGYRTADHNVLLFEGVEWEDVIKWGVVVVPETETYISNDPIEKYDDLGYSKLPEHSNHLMGNNQRHQGIDEEIEM